MSNGDENNLKKVEIILTTISGKEHDQVKSFVLPGHICVHQGDFVEFSTFKTDAKLIFPNNNLLHPKYKALITEENVIEIEEGETETVRINPEINSGEYAYAVITTKNEDLASGGSFPRFIVE